MKLKQENNKAEFIIKWTFLEIYNEELHDLLDPATWMTTESMTQYMIQKNQKEISIREEKRWSNFSLWTTRRENRISLWFVFLTWKRK